MKIILEFPYSADFKAGYLGINTEPRRVLTLVRNDNTKTSTSYARYLMSCSLNRYLTNEEHVDHKDDNKLNDIISNLQLLSPKENNVKKNKNLGIVREMLSLICPVCKEEFIKPANQLKTKISNGKIPTCSKSCGGKLSHKKNLNI